MVSASEVERAGVPLAGSAAGPLSPDLEILGLDSAASLAEFDLGHLSSLASGLGTAPGGWTPAARLARAYRAGVSARLVLEGQQETASFFPAPGLQEPILYLPEVSIEVFRLCHPILGRLLP